MLKYYSLQKYIDILKKDNLVEVLNGLDNILERKVLKVTYNSKEVDSDTIFICKGLKFKKEYLDEALANKPICYICEKNYEYSSYPHIVVRDVREALALISNYYYNDAVKKVNMIGITGTKGKSTTAYYIKSIIDNYTKRENAIASSIDTYDGISKKESLLTSPESLELHRLVYNATTKEIKNFIMEVSSQALKYKRVYNIMYDVAAFLNISQDHISDVEHPDFEDYFNSKLLIFKQAKNAVINKDSSHYEDILREARQVKGKVLSFSTLDEDADIYAYDIEKKGLDEIHFMVRTPSFNKKIVLNMPGLFNVENALAAIAIALILGIPYECIYEGLKVAKASGRMEAHTTKDKKQIAIVDYAHNKLSFEKLYASVKEEYPQKRIITVFGCPGGKAFIRRKDLGILSGKNSFLTYLTAEDSGCEDTEKISEEIAGYVASVGGKYKIVNDRGEAIKQAILDNPESVVLITGKGNETRQKYGNEYLPYKSDTYYVLEALKEYEDNLVVVNN